jgi:integrase
MVTRNAAALVEVPQHQTREIQPLTPEQARTLLDSVRPHRLGAIVSVGMALGLRQGEALGLRWQDVDFDLALGPAWQDSGLVFTSPIGTPLDPRNVTREFQTMLAAAPVVPRVRFHDLRHTAATLLLAQAVDPRTIMETLGHSQISLTLNTYSHVLPALQADAAAKLDAILSR